MFEDLGVIDKIVASGGEYPVERLYTDGGPVDKAVVATADLGAIETYLDNVAVRAPR